MIKDVAMYADRNYVAVYKMMPIYELGVTGFRELIMGLNSALREELPQVVAQGGSGRGGGYRGMVYFF